MRKPIGFVEREPSPPRGPSTPRVAPQVLCPSPFRRAASAAPPQGRGPLFTSPGHCQNRLRDGPGATGSDFFLDEDLFMMGTAPPQGRGPLFASPGRHRKRLRDDHGARVRRPRQASGLFFPKDQPPPRKTDQAARPIIRFSARPSPRHAPIASSKPQGFSFQNDRPPTTRTD